MAGVFFQGFLLNAGLIVAIGTQNAFVIVQGLRRRNVFVVALVCSLCDSALIGGGLLLAKLANAGGVTTALSIIGIVFLLWFGGRALRSAWRGESLTANDDDNGGGLWRAVLTAMAFSLLNPHAILDMAVIFGGVAAGFDDSLRLPFAAGGAAASFVWFFGLGYGAGRLSPYLSRIIVWRVINCIIALIMFAVAVSIGGDLLIKIAV